MKTCYFNGKIFTSNPDQLYADAMVVEDGKIVQIGLATDMSSGCQRIDLKGKTVLPGFVDNHMHPIMLASFSKKIPCLPPVVSSIEDLKREIQTVRQSQGPDKWIEGWGYDEGKLAEGRAPTRWDLDKGCSDAPVSLIRTCGHIRCVNSMALKLAGITRDTPDPEGGKIQRDKTGEPTGILQENARYLVSPFMPEPDEEQTVAELVDLGRLLASQGVVAVNDMGNLSVADFFGLYSQAAQRGMPQYIGIYYMWADYMGHPEQLDFSPEKTNRTAHVRNAGVKLVGDGSISGHTAWVYEPYLGTADYGISTLTEQQLETAIAFCKKNQVQLSIHAMGAHAIKTYVDRLVQEKNWMSPEDVTPYARMEHVTEPPDGSIAKAAACGIAWSTQPIFYYSEIETYLINLGPERLKGTYAIRKYLDAGVKVSLSTDSPATSWATPSNPFSTLKAAVTRIAWQGTDCGQDQAVDLETAIQLYTRESAQTGGFAKLGMLKEGYQACFIILNKDIFTTVPEQIDTIRVDKTYIDGICIYRQNG